MSDTQPKFYTCPKCGDVHTIRNGSVNEHGEHGSACPACGYVYDIPADNMNSQGHLARMLQRNPISPATAIVKEVPTSNPTKVRL